MAATSSEARRRVVHVPAWIAAMMTLEECLRALRAGMNVPAKRRDSDWAHNQCVGTRRLHEAVWRGRHDKGMVRDKVLPLLKRVEGTIRALARRTGDGRLNVLALNISDRWRNISENYLHDKPSEFLPSSLLQAITSKKRVTQSLVKKVMSDIAAYHAARAG
jgi:hypothetical protein